MSTSEPPDTNDAEGHRWLSQARGDLAAAERLSGDPNIAPRIACFLSHLSTEKALKSVLIAQGQPLRKTHDLLDLRKRLPEPLRGRVSTDDLNLLSVWVMEGRYPGDLDDATMPEALECLSAAARVITHVAAWHGSDSA